MDIIKKQKKAENVKDGGINNYSTIPPIFLYPF